MMQRNPAKFAWQPIVLTFLLLFCRPKIRLNRTLTCLVCSFARRVVWLLDYCLALQVGMRDNALKVLAEHNMELEAAPDS